MKVSALGIMENQHEIVKKQRVNKGVRDVKRGYKAETVSFGEGTLYRPEVKIDLERAELLAESFKMTEWEPQVIRRAKALAHYLENETIFVVDSQLLVGNATDDPRSIGWPIEKHCNLVKRLVDTDLGKTLIEDKNRQRLAKILEWWEGKTEWDYELKTRPERLTKYWKFDGTFFWAQWNDDLDLNWKKLLAVGLNGIIKEAQERIKKLEEEMPNDYTDQREVLDATIIAMKGAIKWAERYAQLCRELAVKETNVLRKKQLERMAENCQWVPANPARDLWEAMQSFWFLYCITRLKEDFTGGGAYRFDVIFRPFYEKDIREGIITYKDAVELTAMLWLKIEELGWLISPMISAVYAGTGMELNVTIGGLDIDGRDVCNDLTLIAMDASQLTRGPEPSLCLRLNDSTPKNVILKAIDTIKLGLGYPALYNDKAWIPLLLRYGWPIEDARNYALQTCVVPKPADGKNHQRGMAGWHSLAKDFWWALNKGIDPETGQQHGAATKDPLEWTCIEDALQAYEEQVRFFVDKQISLENFSRPYYAKWLQRPLSSSLIQGCLEQGKDCMEWEYPVDGIIQLVVAGATNVADSLAAIKKWVFEEKKITMAELLEALRNNFEGYDELRKLMLSAPKFGNDDDYVDMIANEVQIRSAKVIEEFKSIYGNRYRMDGSNASTIFAFSWNLDALPDGRKKGEMLADGTVSPMLNMDKNGPTAVLKSASKIDVVNSGTHLLNQRFLPTLLEGEGREKFADYLKTWLDLGIGHIQFNCVSSDIMRKAQKNPKDYTHLVVRIAGYSAYFVDLSKGLQDGIIARTEHATM